MDLGFTTAAYVVAAILFILSLGGLSGQESAKRAVWYGIVGMALAVFATLIGAWIRSVVLFYHTHSWRRYYWIHASV